MPLVYHEADAEITESPNVLILNTLRIKGSDIFPTLKHITYYLSNSYLIILRRGSGAAPG